jgi:threonyl-tRNA synthetase
LLVIGDKEVNNQQVAVRTRTGEDLGAMDLQAIANKLHSEIGMRGRFGIESETE